MHRPLHSLFWLLLVAVLLANTSCDRAGPSQTVLDWEIYLDVRTAQALDRWMAGAHIATSDNTLPSSYHSIPAKRWLQGEPHISEGTIPSITVTGTVTEAPAPVATALDMPVEKFPHPFVLVIRDQSTGNEWARRELTPGYNTFKTFLDATTAGEAGFLYRGSLLLITPLAMQNGRHQSITVTITADRQQTAPTLR